MSCTVRPRSSGGRGDLKICKPPCPRKSVRYGKHREEPDTEVVWCNTCDGFVDKVPTGKGGGRGRGGRGRGRGRGRGQDPSDGQRLGSGSVNPRDAARNAAIARLEGVDNPPPKRPRVAGPAFHGNNEGAGLRVGGVPLADDRQRERERQEAIRQDLARLHAAATPYAADDATQTYLSGSFAQRVMSLGDFIAQYFEAEGDDAADSGGDDARGYLAQHPLFDQVPALRRDIAAPFVCAARTAEDREAPDECERRDEPLASAWFGPGGTVSPLHNDPYHNALCQVLGWKYVRLYDARETPRLYRRPGALCNNSFVDLDAPDAEAHPRFAAAPYHQAVIGPGDCLYIPRHCWHYVRSLSPSFSVSFWWGARMALVDDADGVRSAY